MGEPDTGTPRERRPWPMTWVVAAIAAYVVLYTAINLGFRKPGPAHEPAAEAQARQESFVQATMHGWTRYAVKLAPVPLASAEPSADVSIARVSRAPAPDDLARAVPLELTLIFPGKPSMHDAPEVVTAPARVPVNGTWRIQLQFGAPTADAHAFGEALAYAKDHHLRLFLQDERRTPIGMTPTPAAAALELSLPPGVLPAGDWHATLYTKDAIFTWAFAVPPET